MLFQRKIDRAQTWLRERNGVTEGPQEPTREGDLPSMEELKAEAQSEIHLDKGDLPAMIIAALVTILPACILVLLLLVSFLFFL